jgi:hypothetical protein
MYILKSNCNTNQLIPTVYDPYHDHIANRILTECPAVAAVRLLVSIILGITLQCCYNDAKYVIQLSRSIVFKTI